MKIISNPELELAWKFVEKTDRNIFLTGKAGTGKTTFLHKIKTESRKRLVVVAPTGVAAINAKGVTIHSFFQLPFGPILPEEDTSSFHQRSKNQQRKFNRKKIDIIRSLDLLIIDEISMVRADLLDGIDQVLRRYKHRNKIFGGVQVLMIGDLQQLAPVVKHQDWDLLRAHYPTPYFFSSQAYQQSKPVGVELKHIYRQDDETFIHILNEIRNDQLSAQSAQLLNARYQPDFIPPKDSGFITLTTHNNRANQMNQFELDKNENKSYFYQAEIDGEFPEHAYPTHEKLELKNGAQVMFIKNDRDLDKRYFNGKIGTIVSIGKESLKVRCPDDENDIEVHEEIWENVKYSIDTQTKAIEESIVGSFSQIPLRLAWAITIHKSQGLTFDKAIIDAESSFAHGQTYVALSRCKTLEGIVLKKPIQTSSIINDQRVTSFTKAVEEQVPDEKELDESQKNYQLNLLQDLFDFQPLIFPVKRLISLFYTNESILKGNVIEHLFTIKDKGILELEKVSKSFANQLLNLSKATTIPENDPVIQERIQKAISYFLNYSGEHVKQPLGEISFSTDNKAVKKDLNKQLKILEERLFIRTFCLEGLKDGFGVKKYLALRADAILQDMKPKRIKQEFTATEHPALFEELRKMRLSLAQNEDIRPYQIFTQESLFEMCIFLPTTGEQLRAISGMGKVRVERYGAEIIEIIQNYALENDVAPKEDILDLRKPKKKQPAKGETQKITLELLKTGLNIADIAQKRGLVASTIEGHLCQYIAKGEISITDIIEKERYFALKKLIEESTFEGLSELKTKIGDQFSYGEMKMVLSDIKFRAK